MTRGDRMRAEYYRGRCEGLAERLNATAAELRRVRSEVHRR